jgi:hypothetical protein
LDIFKFVGGVVGGLLGSSAITPFIMSALKERWLVDVKAKQATELAKVKDSLEREQKALQAQLDRGNYVTQAQYDLELLSYKELWLAISELREQWRGFFVQARLHFKDEEARVATVNKAFEEVTKANDSAVLVSGKFTPFYERNIYTAAQAATQASTQLLLRSNECEATQTALPTEEIELLANTIYESAQEIDRLIRARLSSLSVL